jgi:phage terminase Nu1 subunit (DNA packaging protein)
VRGPSRWVIQAAITQLNSNLEDRAKRNNLIMPKPWGHVHKPQLTHEQKHAHNLKKHREYAERLERERAHWVKAIAALKEAPPEERDRIIKTLSKHAVGLCTLNQVDP